MVLAEYRNGQVRHVAPSTDGDSQTTVRERLEAYAAEQLNRAEA
jgi:hypothetical protein